MNNDELFEMVRAAYERGYNWGQENPDSRPFLNKAAYDYADKTTSALALRTPSDGVKALEWEHRSAIPDKLYERWRAFSLIGEYRIDKTEKGFEWYGPNTEMFCRETLDQAKADAHADFKARILSALTPGKE